ncbi:SMR family transporter [Paenibacillus chungangensis]
MIIIALAVILVLCSGVTHAVWNLYTKSSSNKNVFLWLIHVLGIVLFLPFLIHDIWQGVPLQGYLFMAMTFLFQMSYAFFLPKAYERADMSQAYPIMRGIAALLVPILGVWLFGERLTLIGWLGVAAIVIGLFAIGGLWRLPWRSFFTSYWPILGVGASITCYTLTDKMLLQHISPLSLIALSNVGFSLMLLRSALASREIAAAWKRQWGKIVIGTFLAPGSYILFLFAMTLGPVSQLAPIREISTVVGTLFGIWLLKEADGIRRVSFAGLITAGIIAIGIWGT